MGKIDIGAGASSSDFLKLVKIWSILAWLLEQSTLHTTGLPQPVDNSQVYVILWRHSSLRIQVYLMLASPTRTVAGFLHTTLLAGNITLHCMPLDLGVSEICVDKSFVLLVSQNIAECRCTYGFSGSLRSNGNSYRSTTAVAEGRSSSIARVLAGWAVTQIGISMEWTFEKMPTAAPHR